MLNQDELISFGGGECIEGSLCAAGQVYCTCECHGAQNCVDNNHFAIQDWYDRHCDVGGVACDFCCV